MKISDHINDLKIRTICVNITYKCSMGCVWCDRQLDRLNMDDSHVSIKQIAEMAEFVAATTWPIRRLRVSGGEPLEHPEFSAVMEAMKPITAKSRVRISTARKTGLPDLPEGFRFHVAPPVIKNHMPFMVSPEDLSIRATKDTCKVPQTCGLSYDKWGWCFCPIGSVMSRTIGPNVHSDVPMQNKMDWDICKHCIYSLGMEARHAIQQDVMKGNIKLPSPTFAKVIDEYREKGKLYDKTLHLASITKGKAEAKKSNPQRFIDDASELTILDAKGAHGGYEDLKEAMGCQ